MDANLLLDCFSATLQINYAVRQQAEAQLKHLVNLPGFLGACLDIISSDASDINLAIKKAAAVYFKNRIIRYWNSEAEERVDEDEKPFIKEKLLHVIICADYHIKQQLIPVLRILVSHEFPKKWPTLLAETGALLQVFPKDASKDEDYSRLYTGLLTFSEITRKFRWVANEDRKAQLDPIIADAFPHLLNVGHLITQNSQSITEFTAEILKLILKVYKFVTYYDLPEVLRTKESIVSWGNLHGAIINMDAPFYVIKSYASEEEKSLLQISKCYKWSMANVYRLFQRYASVSLSKKFNYDEFRVIFCEDYLPHLLESLLLLVEDWSKGERWLPASFQYYLLQFFSHCITQKITWPYMEKCFPNLISNLVYPILISSDYLLELFENEPQEYIHLNYDLYDLDSPGIAALGLIATLVEKKRKVTLNPIMSFIFEVLNSAQEQPETIEIAKKKEAIFKILGSISHYLTIPQSIYYSEMEQFLCRLVFPSINSKHQFLRARSLEVISKFSDTEFKDPTNVSFIIQGVLEPFQTTEEISLPVFLEASLAIQAFINLPEFQAVLSTRVVHIMSKLLDLSNELDSDALSMVMQECVEIFSEQLQPFGIELMSKLVEQFIRLANEINEASNVDIENFNGDYEDQSDKISAAIGILNTMVTVLLSFETSQQVCRNIEEIFAPAIKFVLSNKMDDFMAEIGELIENSTFLLRTITPVMWECFELLYDCFEDGLILMYVEEVMPCISNFLLYGQEVLSGNHVLIRKFYRIFQLVTEGDEDSLEYNDVLLALEMIQNFNLCLSSDSIEYHPNIIRITLDKFSKLTEDVSEVKNTALNVNVNNVLFSAVIHNPKGTLLLLQEENFFLLFFERLFKMAPLLTRVNDLNLTILSLIAICNDNNVFEYLDLEIVNHIGHAFATTLRLLPGAIENLARKRKSFKESGIDFEASDGSLAATSGNAVNADALIEEATSGLEQHTNDFVNFLSSEDIKLRSSGYFDESDEQVIEDPLANSPMENINIFNLFKEFVLHLGEAHPLRYNALFSSLNLEEKECLSSSINLGN